MYRKHRRPPIDFEILEVLHEVLEITEEMDLLEAEILEEVIAATERNDAFGLQRMAYLLMALNPKIENIAIMSENGRKKIVLLFRDKTGVIVGHRRTDAYTIRNLIRLAT